MVNITFAYASGERVNISAHKGDTIMQAAVDNMITGIDAECGGACSCATCHVVIANDWIDRVGRAEDIEKELLDSLNNATGESRLCCQVEISADFDGMTVLIP